MTKTNKVISLFLANGEVTAKSIMVNLNLSRALADKFLSLFYKKGIINKVKRGVYSQNSLTNSAITKRTSHNTHLKNLTEQELLNYETYCGMINRCLNHNASNFKNYGGRGIIICEAWLNDFSVFVRDMGLRPSREFVIDRIDNEKGYYPENCRWVTQQDSLKNKRRKN